MSLNRIVVHVSRYASDRPIKERCTPLTITIIISALATSGNVIQRRSVFGFSSDFSFQFILHFCIFSNALHFSFSCHFICFQLLFKARHLTFHYVLICVFIKTDFQPHFALQHSPHFLQEMHFLVLCGVQSTCIFQKKHYQKINKDLFGLKKKKKGLPSNRRFMNILREKILAFKF